MADKITVLLFFSEIFCEFLAGACTKQFNLPDELKGLSDQILSARKWRKSQSGKMHEMYTFISIFGDCLESLVTAWAHKANCAG